MRFVASEEGGKSREWIRILSHLHLWSTLPSRREMWAAAISLCRTYAAPPPLPPSPPVDSTRKNLVFCSPYQVNCRPFRVRASFSDYPLASRIVVRNLPYSVGESSLLEEFSNFGHIAEVKLVKDKATKMSRGYAFIQYTCQDDAVLALENMDHKKLNGRMIYVELARPGKDSHGLLKTCGPPDLSGKHSENENEKMA